tara:strand:+ start:1452 stop:1826 length:375 start_codon:yes stop_codon:yes gene_type:complete
MKSKLTDKQERFVSEYLIDLNATQAAIRAGYSENCASETGYENLRKPQIADAIAIAKRDAAKRNETTVDMIDKMHKQAFTVANTIKQPAAMTASAQNLAKLHGLIVDKSEQVGDLKVNIIEGFL